MARASVLAGGPGITQIDSLSTPYGLRGEVSPDEALELQAINRRQMLANLLMQRGLQQPQGQMAGRFYVAPSPVQGLANLAQVMAGTYITKQGDAQRQELAKQSQQQVRDALSNYYQQLSPVATTQGAQGPGAPKPTGIQRGQGYQPEEMNQPWTVTGSDTLKEMVDRIPESSQLYTKEGPRPTGTAMQERTPQDKQRALMELLVSSNPRLAPVANFLAGQQRFDQEQAAEQEKMKQEQAFRAQEGELTRDITRQQLSFDKEKFAKEQELSRERLNKPDYTTVPEGSTLYSKGQPIGQGAMKPPPIKEVGAPNNQEQKVIWNPKTQQYDKIGSATGKFSPTSMVSIDQRPMPPEALKMQDEALQAINTAASVRVDAQALRTQLEKGELNLGAFSNWWSAGKNKLGLSDPESRKFHSFMTTVEKMRNDSLRLNKGTQTEGDAQRAWDELFQSFSDPALVKARLAEIEALNERAVEFHKQRIQMIRDNYGKVPLNTSGVEQPPTAIGATPLTADEQRELEELRRWRDGR